jgi:23S rRNA pseudouridine2605 synthase
MERLQKFLAHAGVASRRAAEQLILDGRVKVNGAVVKELGSKVEAGKDVVLVDGRPVVVAAERHWYLFHKPPGVVTTLKDPQGRDTVGNYVQDLGVRVYPVGRLDYDAEGALLLTDDGELANRLMHPKNQVPRIYLAKVKGEPTDGLLEKLKAGVRLEDGTGKALDVSRFDKAEKNTWLRIVVTEGRPHFVKRLCAAIGHPCLRLFRPVHAGISVKGLSPGTLRPLTPDEVQRVHDVAQGTSFPEPPLMLPPRRHGKASDRDEAPALEDAE